MIRKDRRKRFMGKLIHSAKIAGYKAEYAGSAIIYGIKAVIYAITTAVMVIIQLLYRISPIVGLWFGLFLLASNFYDDYLPGRGLASIGLALSCGSEGVTKLALCVLAVPFMAWLIMFGVKRAYQSAIAYRTGEWLESTSKEMEYCKRKIAANEGAAKYGSDEKYVEAEMAKYRENPNFYSRI
jgi:hypothetical protein